MNNFLKLVVIHYILTINIMCNNEYPETDKKKFSGNDQTSDNKIEEIMIEKIKLSILNMVKEG